MASNAKSFLTRVLGSRPGGTALANTDSYLQERVQLYTKILFFFFSFMTALMAVKFTLPRLMTRFGSEAPDASALAICLALVAFVAHDWWWLARAERSARRVLALDAVGTFGGAVMVSTLAPLMPMNAPEAALLLAVVFMLVIRAATVPSTHWRTLLIGLACTAVVAVATYKRALKLDLVPGELLPVQSWQFMAIWGVIFSVGTAIVSRVIYGLQQTVREAIQLGNYTLERKLGEGGMGIVYIARHALLRRDTAVKLLPPNRAGEKTIARFEREVQQTSRLRHPNTVQIFDFGRTPDGIFYYAMEYLDGLNLEELVELEGPQPPGRVIYILAQVAHALDEAHGVGLIHRDIKPANILLCDRGGVADMAKVVDFGLVKDISGEQSAGVTQTNVITGTPLYIAPEAITSPDVDGRADIYALAAVGFFLLTGEPLFNGKSPVEVCANHLHTPPDRPSDRLQRRVPEDLEDVLLRALAKSPDERFESAAAFRRALLACDASAAWDLSEAARWWTDKRSEVDSYRASVLDENKSGTGRTIAIDLGYREKRPCGRRANRNDQTAKV